jgi:dCMP deaminase
MNEVKALIFMGVAYQIAELGTCDRLKVGAVVIRDGRCVSWGYNGAPPGLPHCEQNNHGYGWDEISTGCKNATHAEVNALAFAARQGISTDGADCFVTTSPCDVCARLLIAAGISNVFYDNEYRDPAGRELLGEAGVTCLRISVPSIS